VKPEEEESLPVTEDPDFELGYGQEHEEIMREILGLED
jgi:hypothetical protein